MEALGILDPSTKDVPAQEIYIKHDKSAIPPKHIHILGSGPFRIRFLLEVYQEGGEGREKRKGEGEGNFRSRITA